MGHRLPHCVTPTRAVPFAHGDPCPADLDTAPDAQANGSGPRTRKSPFTHAAQTCRARAAPRHATLGPAMLLVPSERPPSRAAQARQLAQRPPYSRPRFINYKQARMLKCALNCALAHISLNLLLGRQHETPFLHQGKTDQGPAALPFASKHEETSPNVKDSGSTGETPSARGALGVARLGRLST